MRCGQQMTISPKVAHVKGQGQSRKHGCHWTGCTKQVPPAVWGCSQHWFKLPSGLRAQMWAAYEIGQEVSMTPSDEYLDVAQRIEEWITANG